MTTVLAAYAATAAPTDPQPITPGDPRSPLYGPLQPQKSKHPRWKALVIGVVYDRDGYPRAYRVRCPFCRGVHQHRASYWRLSVPTCGAAAVYEVFSEERFAHRWGLPDEDGETP
jgi:hypothetical protein